MKVRPSPDLFPSLADQGAICVDCETYDPQLKTHGPGWHRPGTFIAGVAVGTEAGFRHYYPVRHENDPDNLDVKKVFGWLKDQMKLPVPKTGANLGYDIGFLGQEDVEVHGPIYDVQVAEPLLDEDRFSYSLEAISKDYLGVGKVDEVMDAWLVDKFGKKNPKQNIWRAPSSVVAPYAVADVNHPLEIFAKQKPRLEAEGLWDLFVMESKLVPILYAMRKRGVRVDLKRAEELRDQIKKQMKDLQAHLGEGRSVWAAADLAPVLAREGLTYPLTPKTQKPSITKEWLDTQDHPLAKVILELRQLDKLVGTFLEGSILEAHVSGRVHTTFNQLKGEGGGAVSGRFSSVFPNLQFIPARTENGKMIRKMFLPDEEQMFFKADWSQIEYRLIASDAARMGMPGASEVVQRYREDADTDFHQVIADMTGLSRQQSKTINFGCAYGEGKDKLARSLGLSVKEGEALLREYHRRAPFIKPLSDLAMNMAQRNGVVQTLMGRKRRFDRWEITKWNNRDGTKKTTYLPHRIPGSRRAFTHAALNARIQGSAADIMKVAMVQVWESGVTSVIGVPQMTVHDELDGSFPDTRAGKEAINEVKKIMETCVIVEVPLNVDLETGLSWGSCSKEYLSTIPSSGRGGGFPDTVKKKRKIV